MLVRALKERGADSTNVSKSKRMLALIELALLHAHHSCVCACVHCAVTTMSGQVPTITDTTVRQPVDSEAVSSTADTTGRFIEGPHVSSHGGLRLRSGYETSWCGLVLQYRGKHVLKRQS